MENFERENVMAAAPRILLPANYTDSHTYRIVLKKTVGAYCIIVAEEPPQRRVFAYIDEEQEDDEDATIDEDEGTVTHVVDLPLPWTYTYIKLGNGYDGMSLWDTRVFFSPVQITDPTKQGVYRPYLPNIEANLAVCWGEAFTYDMPADHHIAVRRVLSNFWSLGFNGEIPPAGEYFNAVRAAYGLSGKHMSNDMVLRAFERCSVEDVCHVTLGAGMLMSDNAYIPGMTKTGKHHPQAALRLYARYDEEDDEYDDYGEEPDYDDEDDA